MSNPKPSLLHDTYWLSARHFRLMTRTPASILSAILFPLVFAGLFYAVFSGLMEQRGIDYGQYLLPAIVIQAMMFAAISSSIWAAQDSKSGMVNRLRSMPIARSTPVISLMGGELARCAVSVAVLLAAGYAMGFRFERGLLWLVPFIALALGCAAAGCMAYLTLGFALGDEETVRAVSGLLYYPLVLVSNLFVPTAVFPDWLQPFVEHQPLSRVVDALRAVSTTGTDDPLRAILLAVVWMIGVVIVFAVLSPRAFARSGRAR